MREKLNCAIIGTGKIGIDVYIKCKKSRLFENIYIYNKNSKSEGAKYCKNKKFNYSSLGIDGIIKDIKKIDIVYDASNVHSNKIHYKKLRKHLTKNKFMINFTPSNYGDYYIPYFKINKLPNTVNLVTCGGQSSIPMISEIKKIFNINYFELVSAISSKSAGFGTRQNVDEYINNTKRAILKTCKLKNTKIIFNLNPSEPPVTMTNSMFFKINDKINSRNKKKIFKAILIVNIFMQKIIPGYHARFVDIIDKNIIKITISITGQGDYLPKYSGNLDIITSIGVNYAKKISEKKYFN